MSDLSGLCSAETWALSNKQYTLHLCSPSHTLAHSPARAASCKSIVHSACWYQVQIKQYSYHVYAKLPMLPKQHIHRLLLRTMDEPGVCAVPHSSSSYGGVKPVAVPRRGILQHVHEGLWQRKLLGTRHAGAASPPHHLHHCC